MQSAPRTYEFPCPCGDILQVTETVEIEHKDLKVETQISFTFKHGVDATLDCLEFKQEVVTQLREEHKQAVEKAFRQLNSSLDLHG